MRINLLEGIIVNDLIVKFGNCSYYNHNNLQYMSEVVKANVNKEIEVELLREEKKSEENLEAKELIQYQNKTYRLHKIVIIPKIWKGQGVLG